MESGFALKLHALLCRPYIKGRDWFDFVWYVARKTRPDLELLGKALEQQGPWAGQAMTVTMAWVRETLENVILSIDWSVARNDIQRFLPLREQQGLQLWGVDFFLHHLGRMDQEGVGS
jgi:hypothetical protein